MTAVLSFERRAKIVGGCNVRRACFERRSSLPLSAACVVANGIRETLGTLIGQPVRVHLMEPLVPDPAAWAIVTSGARLYQVRGTLNDAAFILRRTDALRLVRAVFGEGGGADTQELSPIEEEVLRRLLRSLATTLTPVCGNAQESVGLRSAAGTFLTFFEVFVEEPATLRLGIALARETPPERGSTLRPEDLLDVELEAAVEFASTAIDGDRILALAPNVTLQMRTRIDAPGRLKIGHATIALGQSGSRGERRAFLVGGSPAAKP